MRRLRTLAVLALAGAALSGCTLVATNSAPVRIPVASDPYGLFNLTIPGTNNARVRFITQPVYFVDTTGHLTPSSRIVPSPPTLATVIGELLLGPTAIETSAGYTSALPTAMVLVSATVRNQIGYFNFATPLSSLPRAQQLQAVGQLVLTAFAVGATRGISVNVAGVTQRLLTPGGARSTFVSQRNFQSLLY
ncbi:MAG: GerMN domain-containing protein [Acidimicrobiales bacterium]